MSDPRLQRSRGPVKVNAERDSEIRERYASGESMPELARCFDLTYQRVHQIIRHGGTSQRRHLNVVGRSINQQNARGVRETTNRALRRPFFRREVQAVLRSLPADAIPERDAAFLHRGEIA